MRAGYIKANLAAVASFGPDVQEQLAAGIPEVIDEIDRAAFGDWLPVHVNVALTHEVCDLVGRSGVRNWNRRTVLGAVQGPLLRPLWRAVASLFGPTPSSVLRRSPLGWELVYQDCGFLTVVPLGPNRMQLRVEGARGPFLDDEDYVEWTCGGLEGALDLGGARGSVYAHMDPAAHRVEFDVRW